MLPGAIAFTRTPLSASANDIATVICLTPPLQTAYDSKFGLVITAWMEDILIMAPLPCFTICLAAACPDRKKPFKLIRNTRSKSSSSISRISATCKIAAFEIITSKRPYFEMASPTSASTWLFSPTSHATKCASPPASRKV